MQPVPPINKEMTSREWAMLLTLSLLWGGSFFFQAIAVKALPTFTVVACRLGLAALILIAVMLAFRIEMPRDRAAVSAFAGMGFLNNAVPFSLLIWGQSHIPSGLVSILNATTPLFTVIAAHFLTNDEKLTPARLVGVLIGLAGVAGVVGTDALQSFGIDVTAQLACIGAAMFYAVAGIFGRRFRCLGISPIATAAGQLTASSLMMIPMALLVDRPWTLPAPGLEVIGALVGVAALSTALAFILYFRILATAGATNLLLVTLLIPVSAILLGVLLLHETLLPKHLFGMAMIGLGLAAIDGRPWKLFLRVCGRKRRARRRSGALLRGRRRGEVESEATERRKLDRRLA
jgi:drug/metabolite transporter (DMT)-like permease